MEKKKNGYAESAGPVAGASAEEWDSALSAGLGGRLLPCVCDPSAKPTKGSGIDAGQAAKVPSQMSGGRTFCGIAGWTRRPPASGRDVSSWRSRPEHGILCRTGWLEDAGVVYAVDADVEDSEDASAALGAVLAACGLESVPVRSRGSARWACLLREPGETAEGKRVVPMSSGVVEILGRGGQLAVAGRHPSGSRYCWSERRADGMERRLPGPAAVAVPAGTTEKLVGLLSAISTGAALAEAPRGLREIGESYDADDSLADWLKANADVVRVHGDGRIDIRCPWASEHTGGGAKDKPQDATYFPAGLNGYAQGGFRCLHAHSGAGGRERGLAELAAWARDRGWGGHADGKDFPDVSSSSSPSDKAPARVHVPENGDGSIGLSELDALLVLAGWRDDAGKITSNADSVTEACRCPDCIGHDVRFDSFMGCLVSRPAGTDAEWEPLTDETLTDIRCHLERYGYKSKGMSFDVVSRCAELAGSRRKMDTMADHLASEIPAWDGVRRWEGFFRDRCGATDSPDYLAALGRYLGAALWGRASCTSPDGIKADVVPVLIGEQGTRKSTMVKVLAMDERWTADVDLSLPSAELARACLHRLTVEVPELSGLGKRESAELKAMISKAYDDVRPLYRSRPVRHPRRCVYLMTTNEQAFLTDPTGNRRFAPVHTSGILDIEGTQEDLLQLWAEGREILKAEGLGRLTASVQELAGEATESATIADREDDDLGAAVARLRASEESGHLSRVPLTMSFIMRHWLGMDVAYTKGGQARGIGGKLQKLGMVSVRRLVPIFGGGKARLCVWELSDRRPITYLSPVSEDGSGEGSPMTDDGNPFAG